MLKTKTDVQGQEEVIGKKNSPKGYFLFSSSTHSLASITASSVGIATLESDILHSVL